MINTEESTNSITPTSATPYAQTLSCMVGKTVLLVSLIPMGTGAYEIIKGRESELFNKNAIVELYTQTKPSQSPASDNQSPQETAGQALPPLYKAAWAAQHVTAHKDSVGQTKSGIEWLAGGLLAALIGATLAEPGDPESPRQQPQSEHLPPSARSRRIRFRKDETPSR